MSTLVNDQPLTGAYMPPPLTSNRIHIPTESELDAILFGPTSDHDEAIALAELEQLQIKRQLLERELARRNFKSYIEYVEPDYHFGWFHDELIAIMDQFIKDVEAGKLPCIMIFVPPRHGKSYLLSELFPSYLLGTRPHWEVISATYNQGLASKFGRRVRMRLSDPRFNQLFPASRLRDDVRAMDYMETVGGGFYKATSIGGMLTGMGYNIGIYDDPVKGRKDADSPTFQKDCMEWFSGEFVTRGYGRLKGYSGIIGIQTRWHELDLSGQLLAQDIERIELGKTAKWKVISYPAIAEEDEIFRLKGEVLCDELADMDLLNSRKDTMLPRDWNSLFQQKPVSDEGTYFLREWIKNYKHVPQDRDIHWYVTCDPAIATEDYGAYSAIVAVGIDYENNIYIDQVIREKLESAGIVKAILDLAKEYKVQGIIVEGGAIYTSGLKPELAKQMQESGKFFTIHKTTPITDKEARARPLQGRMQLGRVTFRKTEQFDDYILPEFMSFPTGRFKDIVDATAWFAIMLHELAIPLPPKKAVPVRAQDLQGTHAYYEARNSAHVADKEADRHRPAKLYGDINDKSFRHRF